MSSVIAGQPLPLLSQWFDFEGGTLTNLDTLPTVSITNIGTGGTAVAATTSGVTHPGTGSYGYTWTPAAALAAGAYLVLWSGLKSGAPVTASETVTVLAAAASEAANTSPHGIWYATREDVKQALDVKETARNDRLVDRALEGASRSVEALCHRRFYPVAATRSWDWPNGQYAASWRLWLDDNELITVSALTSGGSVLAPGGYLLEPNRSGPPYNRLEINLGTDGAFGGGNTHQRDISITGLYGYRDDQTTVGALAEALDATETGVDVDGPTSAAVGVGSIIRVDGERMLVTDRRTLNTGQAVAGSGLAAQANAVAVTVADATVFAIGEVLLVDSERLLIVDIAGNTLTVKRAWDGSVLAAHPAGALIYAARTLTVRRAALGTTAATHAAGTPVNRWEAPGPVRDLVIAEALNTLLQGSSGYARTVGSGENQREARGRALHELRASVYASHGRKARIRGV